jgi:hypothetical protein
MVYPELVAANHVTTAASAAEQLNQQRYQGEDQKQMNQEARDMVHDEAADPGEKQQHSQSQPNEATHKASSDSSFNMDLNSVRFN